MCIHYSIRCLLLLFLLLALLIIAHFTRAVLYPLVLNIVMHYAYTVFNKKKKNWQKIA